jgi:hypothetical protein
VGKRLTVVLVRWGITCACAFPFLASAAEDDYVARAVSTSGKVLMRVDTEGGSPKMVFLKPGDRLYKGSIVNTGSDGAVKLLMTDRTIVDLGPSSLFKVNDYKLGANVGERNVDVSLDYGQVRTSVNEKLTSTKGKFTVRTKTATMGVRGTEFVVHAPVDPNRASEGAKSTSLTVLHGKVEVVEANRGASAIPVAVTPGFQFSKNGEEAGKVARLPSAEISKIKSVALHKDRTFMRSIAFDSRASAEHSRENSTGSDRRIASAPETMPGQQALDNIAANLEKQAQEPDRPQITDLKLPGTFKPDVPVMRPIDQLNGRMVNLKVRICPPNAPGC